MNWIYLIIGLLLLCLIVVDVIWTTLWVDGGSGPLSKRIMRWIWTLLKKLDPKDRSVLRLSGPVTLMTTLMIWVLLLWLSWCFILAAIPNGLTSPGENATTFLDYFFYTGNILFTLGSGDYSVHSQLVKGLNGIIAAMGMMFLTLGVSFTLGVVEGVVQERALASSILAIAPEPKALVKSAWNGETFYPLGSVLMPFSTQLSEFSYRLKAYPLLAYYHSAKPGYNLPDSLKRLHEELVLLYSKIQDDENVNPIVVESTMASIKDYFSALNEVFHGKYSPPSQNISMELEDLQKEGIPLVKENSSKEK